MRQTHLRVYLNNKTISAMHLYVDYCIFELTNFLTNEPSVQWSFERMNFRNNEPSDLWPFEVVHPGSLNGFKREHVAFHAKHKTASICNYMLCPELFMRNANKYHTETSLVLSIYILSIHLKYYILIYNSFRTNLYSFNLPCLHVLETIRKRVYL